MQVMPTTARTLGIDPDELFNAAVNIRTGVRYLRFLADRYAGHTISTLAAYNAGPTRFERGAALPRETEHYIERVRTSYAKHLWNARHATETIKYQHGYNMSCMF